MIKKSFNYLLFVVVLLCWKQPQASVILSHSYFHQKEAVLILQARQKEEYQRGFQYRRYPRGYCEHFASGDLSSRLIKPLLSRICVGDFEGVRRLIETGSNSHNPDQIWVTGESPLILAAKKGYIHIVHTLVFDYSVNVCGVDNVGLRAANWADELGFLSIANFLYHYERLQNCDTL